MSDSNELRIRELIAEINGNCDLFLDESNRLNAKFWQFNRIRFLEIDDRGGHSVLGYKYDKDFLAAEFSRFHKQWVMAQRTAGRIERAIGLPVGTVSSDYVEPLRQFYVRTPKGQSNSGSGTNSNPEGEKKIRQAYAEACKLSAPNPPSKIHIEKAVAAMAERGEAKAVVNRSTYARKRRESINAIRKQLEELQEEIKELTDYKKFVDAENERLRAENKRLKSMFKSVAA
ncbi:MAG TPA: hypothetical protein V6D19_05475 [Stenomitos sp.]